MLGRRVHDSAPPHPSCCGRNPNAWQDSGFPSFGKGQRTLICELTHSHPHRHTHAPLTFNNESGHYEVLNVCQAV